MIDIPVFEKPSWLNSQDATTIQQRMMNNLPKGLDNTEGGFPWDLTKPTALEISEVLQFYLTEALKQTYSFWAGGNWLDLHAKEQSITRKSATYAEGILTVEGEIGTVIPEGFVFSTKATATEASKNYAAQRMAVIDDSGAATVYVIATEPGAAFNTPANTVILMYKPLTGITSITNADVITGGADTESDDELRQRVIQAERGGSQTGCDADYVRWALEVPGVGSAMVDPLWQGPGTVCVIISDANGGKANELLIKRVLDYIVSPADRSQRKAPIGATVTIDTVQFYAINIQFKILTKAGTNVESLCEQIKASIEQYFASDAKDSMAVSYNRIRALIDGREGITALTMLEIKAARTPDVPALTPAEFISIPTGYFPELGIFERVEG